MPWLKLDTALPHHPKVRKLDMLLGRHGSGLAAIVSLWCWADHYAADGNLTRHSADDVAIACGVDPRRVDILDALVRAGFVDRGADGEIHLHEWEEHQGSVYRTRKRNADKAARCRNRNPARRDGHVTVTSPVTLPSRDGLRTGDVTGQEERRGEEKRGEVPPPPPPLLPSPVTPARVAKPDAGTDPEFQAFWAAYPRKAAKLDAAKAWLQTAGKRPPLADLLAAIAEQSRSPQWTRDNGDGIPYPATWLRGERWGDSLTVSTAPPDTRRNPHPLHPDTQAFFDRTEADTAEGRTVQYGRDRSRGAA